MISARLARILGHIIGDGQITDRMVIYWNTDETLLKQWERDMKEEFDIDVWKYLHKGVWEYGTGKIHIVKKINSIGIFGCYSWRVPDIIKNSDKSMKKEFIKTIFDDDGTVYVGKHGRVAIKLYSVNRDGLKELEEIINEFDIVSKIYGPYVNNTNTEFYELRIVGKEKAIKFRDRIGLYKIDKMNKLDKLS